MEEEPHDQEIEARIVTQSTKLLGISLHAISWTLSPKTMRLVGKLNQHPIVVLIDTSSTHCFIDVHVARRVELSMEDSQLVVQVADGETLQCRGYCNVVHFALQPYNFMANLNLITLWGCDIVLRVDQLRNLKTIQWNFADISMKFKIEGQKFLLQGLKPYENSWEEGEKLSKTTLLEGKGIQPQFVEAVNT